MSKYYRNLPIISEQETEDYWLKQVEKAIEKGAVTSRSDKDIFDQINSILNTKSKYPSVQAAVKDMQERSGLTAYVNKLKNVKSVKKIASDENNIIEKKIELEHIPTVIKLCPKIKSTLQNIIDDSKGNSPIPAILERLKSIHRNDINDSKAWENDDIIYYISNLNLHAKKNNPDPQEYNNLGKNDLSDNDIDSANTDAFFSLNPARY